AMAADGAQATFVGASAHVLGAASYGALARLVTAMVVLNVSGIALQTAAAREGALGRLGHGRQLAAAVASWGRHLALAFVGLAVVSLLARHPLAAIMSVDQVWAAASKLPVATLWLFLSLERGQLSGRH